MVTACRPLTEGSALGLVLSIPACSGLFEYAVRRKITLEIDGSDDDGGTWDVQITGVTQRLAADDDRFGTDQQTGSSGPAVDRPTDHHLYLPASHIGGSVAQPVAARRHDRGVEDD